MKPTIFIADDHPILLRGLKDFLTQKNFTIVGEANEGQTALNFILKEKPDIAILDISMPNLSGIEIAKTCKQNRLSTKVILMTMHKEVTYYLNAKKHNIYGYLLKDFAIDEIENCIVEILKGNRHFSKKIKNSLEFTEEDDEILSVLSFTELRILKLIAQYKTNKEIAEILFISYRTVEKHRSNIIYKLGLEKRTGILLIWIQKNRHLFQ